MNTSVRNSLEKNSVQPHQARNSPKGMRLNQRSKRHGFATEKDGGWTKELGTSNSVDLSSWAGKTERGGRGTVYPSWPERPDNFQKAVISIEKVEEKLQNKSVSQDDAPLNWVGSRPETIVLGTHENNLRWKTN